MRRPNRRQLPPAPDTTNLGVVFSTGALATAMTILLADHAAGLGLAEMRQRRNANGNWTM